MKFEILKPEAISGSGKKAIQEDCMFPVLGDGTIHDRLFIVSDGKGGDGKGFRASEYLCRTVSDYFYQNTCSDEPLEDDILEQALECAREKINDSCGDSFGTSFALLYFHRHGCLAAHVGNAKIYHIRPKERQLIYKSTDNNGVFAPGDGSKMSLTKAQITHVRYGDYFVLMTQGASQMIDDNDLMNIVADPVNDKTKILRLSKLAAQSEDNYTVYLVHVSGVMNEALDETLPENESLLMKNVIVATGESAMASKVTSQQEKPAQHVSKNHGQSQRQSQQSHSNHQPQNHSEHKPAPYEENEREEKDFPIVTVTACFIVLMALGFWFWSQREKDNVEEAPVVEVKKPKTKDTINIMKNTKPKPLQNLDDLKAKEEEAKKKEEEKAKKRQEQIAAQAKKDSVVDTLNRMGNAVVPEQTIRENKEEKVPESAPASTTPVKTTTPANGSQSPSNNKPTTTNGDPNAVTPRPVIPEGE